jgi:cell division protein FtsL
MLDFAAGIETKNYGLRKTTDLRSLLESLRVVLPFVVIAGAFSFHIWVHSQNIHLGYQSQQLNAQAEELLQIRQQFILEEQTLKDPRWLEAVARKNLGLVLLRPSQIIPPPLENLSNGGAETLALETSSRSAEPKKPSALN